MILETPQCGFRWELAESEERMQREAESQMIYPSI
jgi:hypothetical protein